MKKFLIAALAAFFCLAFAVPAMAKVDVGGMVTLDWTYLNENDERASGGVSAGSTPSSNGFKDTNFIIPQPFNRVGISWASDDGALKTYTEIRGGGSNEAASSDTIFNYAWIQWQITPNHDITFGKQTTNFARFIPQQWVGTGVLSLLGIGFGNVHHATSRVGIKGWWKLSDMFGIVWGLYDADVTSPSQGIALATTAPGAALFGTTDQENTWPRIDIALPIRFSWGRLEVSGTCSSEEYDQFPAGADDSYDMYGVSFGGTGSWGMFFAEAELTWGQNLGGGSYRGAEGSRPVAYANAAGQVKVEDSDFLGFFADVGFKFGPNKIDIYYGQAKYENDGDPSLAQSSDSAEFDYTQSFYGISWAIGVAKGFTIRPELNFVDYDKDAQVNATTVNNGKAWLLGLQFQLVF